VKRVRSFLAGTRLGLRVRVRSLASLATATVHVPEYGTRIRRGVRISVGRRARTHLYVGDHASVERGTRIFLGSGTMSIGHNVSVGPGCVLEVDRGGALILLDGATVGAGAVLRAIGREIRVRPGGRLGDYAMVDEPEDAGPGDVRVGRDAHVGVRAVLRPGASIADRAVVPAHAEVGEAFGTPPAPPPKRGRGVEVSVVVSTKNRAEYLPRLFAALGTQILQPARFEVVMVDDGSTDGTPEAMARLAGKAPFAVKIIRREASGGPASGRNEGWRAAKAGIIAFTDDDCEPSPEWLASGLAALYDGDVDLVQGRTLPEPRQEAEGGRFVITNRAVIEGGHYETCNMFYRREVLERLDGFDERFPHPMAEDTDLAWRALESGCVSKFEENALLFHDVRPVGIRGLLRRGRHLAVHAYLLRKHPEVTRIYHGSVFMKPSHEYLAIAVAAGIAAPFFSPWFLLGLAPYLGFHLLDRQRPLGVWNRLAALPALFVVDVVEFASLARASVVHRRLLL
jgi:glycosyltransferase involved in cell wall biosynthesis/acetyltransferase-like isoleucine patch superfamily enzyme